MHEVNKIPMDSVSSLQDRRPSAAARLTPLNLSNQHSSRPLSSHVDYGYPLASPSARSAHRSSAMLSPSSPPDSRRPLSPAAPSEDDFRSLCQAFYYEQDERSGKRESYAFTVVLADRIRSNGSDAQTSSSCFSQDIHHHSGSGASSIPSR